MKKIVGIALIGLFCASVSIADEVGPLSGFTLKQGMVMDWKSCHTKNLTTFEIARTKADPRFGKWNMLWDGWSMDAGLSYDATGANSGALLLGREFGTLGDYLPIEFPLKNLITITIYPVGIYVDNITDSPKVSACSGGSFVKLSVNF